MWEPNTDFRVVYKERDFPRHTEYYHDESCAQASMDAELADKATKRGWLEWRRFDGTWRKVD